MEKRLIGFDMRLSRESYVDLIWDNQRRETYLLKPDIEWPLSVDPMVWPSCFHFDSSLLSNPQLPELLNSSTPAYPQLSKFIINIKSDNLIQTSLGLWDNLEKMKTFKAQSDLDLGIKYKCVVIGIELIVEKSLQYDEFWKAVIEDNIIPTDIPKDWSFLGYDIADNSMISGLSNCGYLKNERESLKIKWVKCLNEFGLLKDLDDALKLLPSIETRVSEHKPFYVYGLYMASGLF